jgi:hypothetical protein
MVLLDLTQTFKVVSKSKEICISKHLDCKSLCRIHYKKANCTLKLKDLSGRAVQFKVCQLILLPYINFPTTSQSMKSKAQWNSIVNKTGKKKKKNIHVQRFGLYKSFCRSIPIEQCKLHSAKRKNAVT